MGTVKLLDVQGKDVEVEDGLFPGRVKFTTLYDDKILFCYVDVDFYTDGKVQFYFQSFKFIRETQNLFFKVKNVQ